MPERVMVTGIGVLTPLGDSAAELHAALIESRVALEPVEFDGASGHCRLAGALRSYEPRDYLPEGSLRPLDRTGRFAASAAALALDDAGLQEEEAPRDRDRSVGLVLGTMFGSLRTISEFDRRAVTAGPSYAKPMQFANSVINAAAGQTAIRHGLTGTNATICGDSTSGLQAIGYAAELIRDGYAETLLAGGAEELCEESFHAFSRSGRLSGADSARSGYPIPFDRRRDGFALAEGAALLVLESETAATRRGAEPVAEILGFGTSYDCSRRSEEWASVESARRAIESALDEAGISADGVDLLSASANGSPRSDAHEADAVASAINGRAAGLPVTAIKSMLGESLGASGALQTVAAIKSLEDGHLPGIAGLVETDPDFALLRAGSEAQKVSGQSALVTSLGLGGKSCALVVRHSGEPAVH